MLSCNGRKVRKEDEKKMDIKEFLLKSLCRDTHLLDGVYLCFFKIEILHTFLLSLEKDGEEFDFFPSLSISDDVKDIKEGFNLLIIEYKGNNIEKLLKRYNGKEIHTEYGSSVLGLEYSKKSKKLSITIKEYTLTEGAKYFEDEHYERTRVQGGNWKNANRVI